MIEHISWGPNAVNLTSEERARVVAKLEQASNAWSKEVEAAQNALKGTSFVAVPVAQLADIYAALRRLTHLGQMDVRDWDSIPTEVKDLKGQIFREVDMATVFAGQWLPKEVRDRVAKETR